MTPTQPIFPSHLTTLFLRERNILFINILHQHNQLLHQVESPNPSPGTQPANPTLPTWFQDLRQDFCSFSALARVIRARALGLDLELPLQEVQGWDQCWNEKTRIIQRNIDRWGALVMRGRDELGQMVDRDEPWRSGIDGSLSSSSSFLVSSGEEDGNMRSIPSGTTAAGITWSNTDLATYLLMIAVCVARLHFEPIHVDKMGRFMTKVHEVARSLDVEEHGPELDEIWETMADVVFCGCGYCVRW